MTEQQQGGKIEREREGEGEGESVCVRGRGGVGTGRRSAIRHLFPNPHPAVSRETSIKNNPKAGGASYNKAI